MIEFHVPNMHIKFRLNRMLLTIRSVNLFFIPNFRSQKLEILNICLITWQLIFDLLEVLKA